LARAKPNELTCSPSQLDGQCSGKFVAPENNSHMQQYRLGLKLGIELKLGLRSGLRVGLRSGLGLGLGLGLVLGLVTLCEYG